MIQTLLIPGELTDLNTYINAERSHRLAAAKIKKAETDRVTWFATKMQKIEVPVHVEILWFTKNRMKDPDNISFAKKFVLDGLVKAGVLKNDGMKQISSFSDTFEVDKDYPRIEVILTD